MLFCHFISNSKWYDFEQLFGILPVCNYIWINRLVVAIFVLLKETRVLQNDNLDYCRAT